MVTSLADCKPMVIILDDEGILSLTLLSGIESWVALKISKENFLCQILGNIT
jgi:hypothetical protein